MSAERIERRSWILGALLLLGSLGFRSLPVAAGTALGVLIAVVNFRLLAHFVSGLFAGAVPRRAGGRLALYSLKYLVIAAVLFAALKSRLAHPLAVAAGTGVLLPAIIWETALMHRSPREETSHARF